MVDGREGVSRVSLLNSDFLTATSRPINMYVNWGRWRRAVVLRRVYFVLGAIHVRIYSDADTTAAVSVLVQRRIKSAGAALLKSVAFVIAADYFFLLLLLYPIRTCVIDGGSGRPK